MARRKEGITPRISSLVLVGRERELEQLAARLDAAVDGRGSSVLVAGEAGIGKTRLVRETAALATGAGFRVLTGGSVDFGGGTLPFGAVAEALRSIPREIGPERLGDILGPALPELGRLLPELSTTPVTVPDIRRDAHATARLFEVILRLLDGLAAETPTLLVFEDLHWADPSTREFFAFAVRSAPARVLVIGTYRSDELHRTHPLRPIVTSLRASDRVLALDLEPLERPVAREQIRAILGREPERAVLDRIYDRTLGNPFFTEELLSADVEGVRLPEDLNQTLLLRLDAVEPATRRVLDALAVIGRPADEHLVGEVTELPPAEVTAALRDALDRSLLVRVADGGQVVYRHALLQEVAYGELLGGERAALHRAVAGALEGRRAAHSGDGSVDLDGELALHYDRARLPAAAIAAAARAARGAAGRYAFPEALAQWERVLDLWEQVEDATTLVGEDKVDVLAQAAVVASTAGNHRRSIALTRAAIELIDPATDPLRAALAHAGLMTELFSEGEAHDAEASRARALELIEDEPASLTHVRVLYMAAYPPLFESRYPEVLESSSRAVRMAEALGAEFESGLARMSLGIATAFLGRLDEAFESFRLAIEIAERSGDPQAIGDAHLALATILEAAGRFDEAADACRHGLERLSAFGVERTVGMSMRTTLVETRRRVGRWAEAQDLLTEVFQDVASGWDVAHGHVIGAHLQVEMGRLDEADSSLRLAGRHFQRPGTGFLGHLHVARAGRDRWAGQFRSSLDHAVEGLSRIGETTDLRWIGELTVAAIRAIREIREQHSLTGDDEPARLAEQAAGVLSAYQAAGRRALEVGTIFGAEFGALHATATAEVTDLATPDPDAWRVAVAAWETCGQPYPAAFARFRLAEAILRRGGDRTEAADALRTSAEAARAIGAAPLLSEVEDLGRRARIRRAPEPAGEPATSASQPTMGLTRREREVLALLAEGRSDGEIADALFISPKTASVHVSNVKAKLGVDRRVEVALLAARILGAPD